VGKHLVRPARSVGDAAIERLDREPSRRCAAHQRVKAAPEPIDLDDIPAFNAFEPHRSARVRSVGDGEVAMLISDQAAPIYDSSGRSSRCAVQPLFRLAHRPCERENPLGPANNSLWTASQTGKRYEKTVVRPRRLRRRCRGASDARLGQRRGEQAGLGPRCLDGCGHRLGHVLGPGPPAANAQCGFLSVPLDYSNPHGQQIQLAVSRIVHTSDDYQGVLLTNPGGPGGSGLNLNVFLIGALQQEGLGSAAAGYDWIGFDPRGVGSSIPALSCIPNYFSPDRPNYVPLTSRLLSFWLAKSKSYARACASANPLQEALLRHMTTRDAALDMDSIREALGQKQITYYGFSYGTYLGQVYSTLFPSHVRRLIMDSNVDPRRVWYQANLDQDIAFNRNINIWFAWLAKYDRVYHLGDTESAVQNLFYATQRQLAEHPAGGQVGPDEWVDALLGAGYYQFTWLQLGQVFSDWIHKHDSGELIAAYQASDGPGNDNSFAVYSAVQCTDVQWPTDWSVWSRDNSRIYREAPFETWGNAWFNAPCTGPPRPPGPCRSTEAALPTRC
jgi:pimeloyl-ACP methyl ester carboxylesterase